MPYRDLPGGTGARKVKGMGMKVATPVAFGTARAMAGRIFARSHGAAVNTSLNERENHNPVRHARRLTDEVDGFIATSAALRGTPGRSWPALKCHRFVVTPRWNGPAPYRHMGLARHGSGRPPP